MANSNAVIIRNSKIYRVPTHSNLAHNTTFNKASYWLNDGGSVRQSFKFSSEEEIIAVWEKWEEEARTRYKNNPLNKRALKSNAIKIEEGLIVFGKHVVVDEDNIIKILNDFVKIFELENNTKILHIAYHNHEGHEYNREEIINRHAHFLFQNVDNTGVMVRRNWKRNYLSKLQDNIYEISKKYIPNIERGKESTYIEKYIGNRYIKVNERKHRHHRVYREKQKMDTLRENLEKVKRLEKDTLNSEIRNLKLKNQELNSNNIYLETKLNSSNNELINSSEKYKELMEIYKKENDESKDLILNQNNIINRLRKFSQLFKPFKSQDIDLLLFIDLIEKGLYDAKAVHLKNTELESKNDELHSEITILKDEIERLKSSPYKFDDIDKDELPKIEEIYDPSWDYGSEIG